jgi:hypothetical protein
MRSEVPYLAMIFENSCRYAYAWRAVCAAALLEM